MLDSTEWQLGALFSWHIFHFLKKVLMKFFSPNMQLKKKKMVSEQTFPSTWEHTHKGWKADQNGCSLLPPRKEMTAVGSFYVLLPPHLWCGSFSRPRPQTVSPRLTDEENELLKVWEIRATQRSQVSWASTIHGGHGEGSEQVGEQAHKEISVHAGEHRAGLNVA